MANSLYDRGRQAFLEGNIRWLLDDIKVVLVDTGAYTVNLATHQMLSDVPIGARIATSTNLTSKTSTAGVAGADNVTFTGVSGVSIEAIVVYRDSGSPTTSELIAYVDTATGLPVTPSGGDIGIIWDQTNKIFKL